MVVEWTWGYGKRWIQEIEKLGYQKDHMHFLKLSLIMIGVMSQKLNYSLECVNHSLSGLWQCTPVFVPGESHGLRSSASYSPKGGKESDTTGWLSTSIVHKYIFIYQSQSPNSSLSPFRLGVLKCVLYVCVSISSLHISSSVSLFPDSPYKQHYMIFISFWLTSWCMTVRL